MDKHVFKKGDKAIYNGKIVKIWGYVKSYKQMSDYCEYSDIPTNSVDIILSGNIPIIVDANNISPVLAKQEEK